MLSRRRLIRASALAAPWIFLPRWANSSIHGSIATGLTVNITHDPTLTGTKAAPGSYFGGVISPTSDAFFDACTQAKADLELSFCSNTKTTVSVQIDYQHYLDAFGVMEVAGGGAQNQNNVVTVSGQTNTQTFWTQIRNALISNAKTSEALSAANALPTTQPLGVFAATNPFSVKTANLRQLGIPIASVTGGSVQSSFYLASGLDGGIGLNNGTAHSLRHEITEVMGRRAGFPSEGDPGWGLMAAFCYVSAGNITALAPQTSGQWAANYFSIDGGTTNGFAGGTIAAGLNKVTAAGDTTDWNGVDDPNDDCNYNGGTNFTLRTKHCMDCLGWQWNGL